MSQMPASHPYPLCAGKDRRLSAPVRHDLGHFRSSRKNSHPRYLQRFGRSFKVPQQKEKLTEADALGLSLANHHSTYFAFPPELAVSAISASASRKSNRAMI